VDHINNKPNFLSVMNYSFQDNRYVAARALDYSPFALAPLSEPALSEPAGLTCAGTCTGTGDSLSGRTTVFFTGGAATTTALTTNIDWNLNGSVDVASVAADVNGDGSLGTLSSRDDWSTLLYSFRGTLDFAEGVHLTTTVTSETDFSLALSQSGDEDHDGVPNVVDNCPLVANPGQDSQFNDGVGTACLATPSVLCVDHRPHGAFIAHFGYDNPNYQLAIPIGPQNQFGGGGSANQGQPTRFDQGSHPDAFTVTTSNSHGRLPWTLNGRTVVADNSIIDCHSVLP